MPRLPGFAWLVVVSVAAFGAAASIVPFAAVQVAGVEPSGITPDPAFLDPHDLAGAGAIVVTGLFLLLFFYRRRLYILFWVAGWVLLAGSLQIAGRDFGHPRAELLAYGLSQFLEVISALMFVAGADAYPARPRLRPGYALLLVPVFLWFTLSPLAIGAGAVFTPGHVLAAGGMALSGIAHLMLLRQVRMLGAAVVGAAMLTVAGSHVWIVLKVPVPEAPGADTALLFSMIPYLIAVLGMQLMTFEDMTLELRRTNRRLENAQAKLRRLVITDPLTGCRNRRFFDEIIGRELNRRRRYGIPLSVLFVDIDNFKVVNDRLGHEAGDAVLRDVAAFLRENIREADYVFRWGGDEFLVLLSCGEEEGRRRGATLQSQFGAAHGIADLPIEVSLSIGCVEVPADARDVKALIGVADERMYADKKSLRKNHTPAR